MKIRITFRSECFVEGNNIEEIKNKFESTTLYSDEFREIFNGDFVELVSLEDADTHENLIEKCMDK